MRNLVFAAATALAVAAASPAFAAGGGTDNPMPGSPGAQARNQAGDAGYGHRVSEATNRRGNVATDAPSGLYSATQAPSGNNAAPEYLGGNGGGH